MPSREFLDIKISALWHLGIDEVAEIARRLSLQPRRVRSGLRRQGIDVPRPKVDPPPSLDPEQVRELLAGRGSCKDAAAALGVGKRRVYRAAAKLGIHKPRGRVSRIDREALAALVAAGKTWTAIGRELGCHPTTARRTWDAVQAATRPGGSSTSP